MKIYFGKEDRGEYGKISESESQETQMLWR